VRIPVWLTLGVAALVIIFGGYRIYLSTRPDEESAQRRGMYRMGKRAHLFVGIVYILLGGGLIATSFGWNPWGDSPPTETPSKDKAPTKSGVPTDQLPK
jgi:hypothetical protein